MGKAIGYVGSGHHKIDRADKRRQSDYQTGILYDSRHLELVESDHVWLSKQPRQQGSKSWDSLGARTVTIAAFRLRSSPSSDVRIVHLNCHLDVWGAEARSLQAELLIQHALTWTERYPHAILLLTGDFNTANGHRPHRLLLQGGFVDSWDACHAAPRDCLSHSFAGTFHGWLGSMINTYMGRILQYIIQTVHGCGIDFPKAIPSTWRDLARTALHVLKQVDVWKLASNIPASLSRLHVDWIMFRQPAEGSWWQPVASIVAEVRDSNFSSDHFPVMTLFEIP